VNQADTEQILRALEDLPIRVVAPDEPADLAVINACTVTANADRDGRAAIYRALRGTNGPVFLTGCLAVRLQGAWDAADRERVRVIPESADREQMVAALRSEVLRILAKDPDRGPDGGRRGRAASRPARTRPILKVQDGCDHRCAYCIVPLVRGRSRSRPLHDLIAQALEYAENGASEVVLAGVDLGAWGRDLSPRSDLARLLHELLRLGTGMRFRLSSLEPFQLTEALVELIGGSPDLCAHLHLPLQSGSDRILAAMRRPYTAREFARRVEQAARRIEHLTLGIDCLCGFPGESPEDFQATYDLVRSLPVTYLHVFPFSPRPRTEAERLAEGPPRAVVAERCAALRALSSQRRRERASEFVGRRVEVVDLRGRPGGTVEALSAEYFRVIREDGTAVRRGRHVVKIAAVRDASLVAARADGPRDARTDRVS